MSQYVDDQSLLSLLDDIAQNIKDAKGRFPGSSYAAVDRDYLLDLVYSARETAPEELAHAEELLDQAVEKKERASKEAEGVIAEAREQAEEIIREAREQASRLVAQDALTVAATEQARRIVDEAKSQAAKLRRGADDYSDQTLADVAAKIDYVENSFNDVLYEVKDQLGLVLEQIQSGRSLIAERSEESQGLRAAAHDDDTPDDEAADFNPVFPPFGEADVDADLSDDDAPSPTSMTADNVPTPFLADSAAELADEDE
ncbi:MAG: hypothetical protein IKS49_07585 [Actinomycetaceae bacterium]|nr:hypothetical protein [Actinomycetaceae bacterium]